MDARSPSQTIQSVSFDTAVDKLAAAESRSGGESMRLPRITFVMPVRNEAAFIERSLGAVLDQDYPAELSEVIVADGMSTDETRQIVENLRARSGKTVRVVDNQGGIVPTGMNAAILQAGGEIIIRVDGHTIIEPDYARKCVEALARTGADNVGGRMSAAAGGFVGEAIALATSSPFGVGGARFHYSDREEWVDTVYLGAWPREVFERIGLFDEEQVRNQDDEFNYRLLARGGKILLCPEIRSKYHNRSGFRSLWRQYFQYGFWKVRVLQKHARQMRARQFVPPAFAFVMLATAVSSPFSGIARTLFLVVFALYLAAALAASIAAARKRDPRLFFVLPFVFGVLHFSYGLGFLAGLVKFWSRWRDTRPRWNHPTTEAPDA
jgi:succinoglycan biosynthesis protein ExoA